MIGTCIGWAIYPVVAQSLVDSYGFPYALIILASIMVVHILIGLFYTKQPTADDCDHEMDESKKMSSDSEGSLSSLGCQEYLQTPVDYSRLLKNVKVGIGSVQHLFIVNYCYHPCNDNRKPMNCFDGIAIRTFSSCDKCTHCRLSYFLKLLLI